MSILKFFETIAFSVYIEFLFTPEYQRLTVTQYLYGFKHKTHVKYGSHSHCTVATLPPCICLVFHQTISVSIFKHNKAFISPFPINTIYRQSKNYLLKINIWVLFRDRAKSCLIELSFLLGNNAMQLFVLIKSVQIIVTKIWELVLYYQHNQSIST